MASTNNESKQNTPYDPQNDENENNMTFASFVEIFCAVLHVGVFVTCVYILKEIFFLANELFVCVDNNFEILKFQLIPALLLLVLAGYAFWIMKKD